MITLDLGTFRHSREGGNVTGVIYLKLAGADFPETGWSDFPVTILGWWTDAWLQLQEVTRRSAQWNFMDGPYSAILEKVPSAPPTDTFQTSEIHHSLLQAAERVLAYCEGHNIPEQHFEDLRANVQRLKANPTLERTATGSAVCVRGSSSRP